MKKPLLVLFDGNAIIHRAFHAFQNTRPLTVSKTGELVSAVYGFAVILLKVLSELKPTHYAIAFDRKAPTFRHQLFEQYKAHRPAAPEELVKQIGRVRQLVEAFHIAIFEQDGFEADDILGTLARQASEQGIDTTIVTGDADTMQLVCPGVKVLLPRARGPFGETEIYDEERVKEKYGVTPEQIIDLKALEGDPSDNIPGVPGIGRVTAVRLIQQFGSLEGIYKHIDAVAPVKLQAVLKENEESARQSMKLATIVIDAPVTLNLEDCLVSHYDRGKVIELFRELEFVSLLPRLPEADLSAEVRVSSSPPAHTCHIVNTVAALDELLGQIQEGNPIVFSVITTDQLAMIAELVGISFSPVLGMAYYIPVGHTGLEQMGQLPFQQVSERIKPVLENPLLAKVSHDGKYNILVLTNYGIEVNNLIFDTMVAAYLLSEKNLTIEGLAFSRLGIEMKPITDLTGTGAKQIPVSRLEIEKVADYACAGADYTGRLADLLNTELKQQGLWKLFDEVEMPLVPVLLHMEKSGVMLDTNLLRRMSHNLGEQLLKLEAEIYNNVGHLFNINSPQQLSRVLFEEIKLPVARKVKGGYSTGAAVLEELRGTHPIIQLILDYRQLAKLKSTYIDSLPGLINPKTRRVHTSFNQTKTTTGRLSSSDPNLQNIPVRGELGKQMRQAFIAPPGNYLLSGDYSQIDLRVLAHISQDQKLLDAFNHDEDIHAATAGALFGVPQLQVTPDMRRLAKTVNFGVIYGMSEYGLEQATELTREEAGKFINAYFEKYPGVRQYIELTKQQAREKGYVQTILGRRRSIPEINSANRQVRESAERMAINMPVQGTSADIIKIAMVNLYKEMNHRKLKSKMLLQVHDELLFEIPEGELEEMRKLVPQIMCAAMKLSVPLKVDIKVGRNWGEL